MFQAAVERRGWCRLLQQLWLLSELEVCFCCLFSCRLLFIVFCFLVCPVLFDHLVFSILGKNMSGFSYLVDISFSISIIPSFCIFHLKLKTCADDCTRDTHSHSGVQSFY